MGASVREQRDGDRRARELYHYFQPDNPALLPPSEAHAAPSASTVKSSPNLVLTALTQLAAVKLGVQRAIIRYRPFPTCTYITPPAILGQSPLELKQILETKPISDGWIAIVTNDIIP